MRAFVAAGLMLALTACGQKPAAGPDAAVVAKTSADLTAYLNHCGSPPKILNTGNPEGRNS